MRKGFISVILLGAFFMALSHTLVPHQHHQDHSARVCNQDEEDLGLLDLLQQSFAHDLGEGHLEYFQKSNASPSFNPLSLISMSLILWEIIERPAESGISFTGYPLERPPVYTLLYFSSLSFRGPPLC